MHWGNTQTQQQSDGRHHQDNLSAASEVCTKLYSAEATEMHDGECLKESSRR
jgi:hypothetical protein